MLRWVLAAVILIFTFNAFAAERVILLAPAAADIMSKLGCDAQIVGKTKSVDEFPNAEKVGSHIRPNMELIMSLSPDLIIIPSNRFFTEEMMKQVGVPVAEYNPITLDEILDEITKLGFLMDKRAEAETLNSRLRSKIENIQMPEATPTVLYEVMQLPFSVAGQNSIVTDIIRKAGGQNIAESKNKIVRYSLEAAVEKNPDIYIYQVGPMNKNPEPPETRAIFKAMDSEYLMVDEKEFSRANSVSFDKVLELNRIFTEFAKRKR
jgi:iron complex transport system substrate-binding protein